MRSKVRWPNLILLLALPMVWTACSFLAREQNPSQNLRILLPWSVPGQFGLQVITLNTLSDVSSGSGQVAYFTYGFNGPTPHLRTFERADGVLIPSDNISQRLLTVYAHLEKLHDLSRKSQIVNEELDKPLRVSVEAKMLNVQRTGVVENNAQFSPVYNTLMFAPFAGDDLPLVVNAGVIGHEYFHAIFNQLVLKPLRASMVTDLAGERADTVHANSIFNDVPLQNMEQPDTECPRDVPAEEKLTGDNEKQRRDIYQIRLLRAMNEGLADLWGWIYSGDTSFVGRSLPNFKVDRDLDSDKALVAPGVDFQNSSRMWGACSRFSGQDFVYNLGTEYAHWLKVALSKWDRKDIARLVVKVLPKLREQMALKAKASPYPAPALLMELFAQEVKGQDPGACNEILGRVYAGDLEKKDLCGGAAP